MKILLICGGRSHEHYISLKSAEFIINNAEHTINTIVIRKDNICFIKDKNDKIITYCDLGCIQIWKHSDSNFICKIKNHQFIFNVAFPIFHGLCGEDGTIQGWLELLSIPYVGCGVLSSAISMDKDIAKRLVTSLGIKTPKYITLTKNEWEENKKLTNKIYPVFVKPASSGSSIGIYKVKTEDELLIAINNSFQYDNKVLIEESIEDAREIEIAILEDRNNHLTISNPGEIVTKHEFYSYEAKYIDPNGAKILIPAPLTIHQIQEIKQSAKKIFNVFACSGMARIDFLLQGQKIFFNEINTIPGFTEISLYPNLLKESGIKFSKLIDILLNNALTKKNVSSNI